MSEIIRCDWATKRELEIVYHDNEWGKIDKDERYLFEMLCLEGMQAGLSWYTILQKRPNYQRVFYNFEIAKILAMPEDEKVLLYTEDLGIVKNKLKINAIFSNAIAFQHIQAEFGNFATYIWGFVDGKQIKNHWKSINELPAKTELSEKVSADLKKRGFKFVGPVIIYSYLQAIGIIDDHLVTCSFKEK